MFLDIIALRFFRWGAEYRRCVGWVSRQMGLSSQLSLLLSKKRSNRFEYNSNANCPQTWKEDAFRGEITKFYQRWVLVASWNELRCSYQLMRLTFCIYNRKIIFCSDSSSYRSRGVEHNSDEVHVIPWGMWFLITTRCLISSPEKIYISRGYPPGGSSGKSGGIYI